MWIAEVCLCNASGVGVLRLGAMKEKAEEGNRFGVCNQRRWNGFV